MVSYWESVNGVLVKNMVMVNLYNLFTKFFRMYVIGIRLYLIISSIGEKKIPEKTRIRFFETDLMIF